MTEPWLEKYLPEAGNTFIDIGANTGDYTKMLAGRFERVIAFEPNKQALEGLRDNLPQNVSVVEIGLSDKIGEETFAVFENSVHTRIIKDNPAPLINTGNQTGEAIMTVETLDRFNFHEVDFIKIDVEGMEVAVVKGAILTVNSNNPILLIEIHFKPNEEAIRNFLPWYDFEIIRHPDHAEGSEWYDKHFWIYGKIKEANA
jgi:FkbM family methyltransferase